MIRRPRRTVPATIVALVLLAACVLTVIAVIQSLAGQTPLLSLQQLLSIGSGQHWNSASVVTTAVVIAVIGLVLVVAAIRPGNPTVLPLVSQIGGTPVSDAGVRRATLAKDLATAVGTVPGVTRADVVAGRRTVTASVRVAAADPASVPGAVKQRLDDRLGEIGPARSPRVRVRTRPDTNS